MAVGGAVLVVTQADYSDWGWGCLRGYPGQEAAGEEAPQHSSGRGKGANRVFMKPESHTSGHASGQAHSSSRRRSGRVKREI